MELDRRQGRLFALLVLAFVAAILLYHLSSFGIWDPWELNPADQARHLASGDAITLGRAPVPAWLVAWGFEAFGVHEWAGRLPLCLSGILVVGIAYFLVQRFAGRRAGVYAALIVGTSPLFLLNARQMLGHAPAFAAQGLVGLAALIAVFRPTVADDADARRRWIATAAWLVGLVAAIALTLFTEGALLGALPPLAAVAVAAGIGGALFDGRDRRRAIAAWVVVGLTVATAAGILWAIRADAATYSAWLGGKPRGGEPPTFDAVFENVFHAFAPWSALLAVALGRMLWPAAAPEEAVRAVHEGAVGTTPGRDDERVGAGHAADGEGFADAKADDADRAATNGEGANATESDDDESTASDEATASDDDGATASDDDEATASDDAQGDAPDPSGSADVRPDDASPVRSAAGPLAARAGAVPVAPRAAAVAIDEHPDERLLRIALLLWAVLGYGALTVYLARYGVMPYTALIPLAGAVALFLRDVEESQRSFWTAAVVVVLFVGLILRDYDLYPGAPIDGLGLENVKVPDIFNPRLWWVGVLGLFALVAALGLGTRPGARRPDFLAPYRGTVALFRQDWPHRLWVAGSGLVVAAMLLFGGLCFLIPDTLGLTTLEAKIGRGLFVLPFVVLVCIALGQGAVFAFGKLGRFRLVPLLVAGAVAGLYISQGWLPALSAHFSPREVYDTYNALAKRDEPLAEYRVGGRAATYYAHGHVRDLASQPDLLAFLKSKNRDWAVFPSDELPAADRAFRQSTGRHLFIADARSARVLLATNQPIAGRDNQNYLASSVLEHAPKVQFPVHARYQDDIELIGYDLSLPHGSYVGAGETFQVTWYWKALQRVPGSYKVFVHVDGEGLRLNGDHDPVDGRYPVRLWDQGDVVVDRQALTVPANYRPGLYTLFIGFYSGEQRLTVVHGPKDDANRVRAGTFRIR